MNHNLIKSLITKFSSLYDNQNKTQLFFAPGRVNLIGEHTDYNGGYVFPCALDIGTYALVAPRSDKICRFYSDNFPDRGTITVKLTNLAFNKEHDWVNYPKGVIRQFKAEKIKIEHGFDILYFGNIPNGAGLSSSASIEVVTGTMLNQLYNANFDPVKIAKLGQKAENKYIGVSCGIMDQFASAMGKKNQAILLDCNTLNYQYAPLNTTGYRLVIANTNKRRGLADSKYNERLQECQTALQLLQTELKIKSLGEIDLATLEANKELIKDKTIYKRARHAVSENQRTLSAVAALGKNTLIDFGRLMCESHMSLRDDYEVTGKELDSLVIAAWQHPGCIGARMTGAGFGGCTVNLVIENQVDNFIKEVIAKYQAATGITPDFYLVNPDAGAREIPLE